MVNLLRHPCGFRKLPFGYRLDLRCRLDMLSIVDRRCERKQHRKSVHSRHSRLAHLVDISHDLHAHNSSLSALPSDKHNHLSYAAGWARLCLLCSFELFQHR